MRRENRYLVLKRKDIRAGLTASQREILKDLSETVAFHRENRGKIPLACVVVESDWPEYEPVWAMIEKRVDAEVKKGNKRKK